MKKLTIEFIREQSFLLKKLTLLSDKYIDANTNMLFRCENGHETYMVWHNIQQGRGCKYCYGNVKYDIEYISIRFKEKKLNLLTTEYKNAHQKLKYICENGHENYMTFHNLDSGYGCPDCSGTKKYEMDYIKLDFLSKKKFVILTDIYINNKQKLQYQCENGHINYMSYTEFKRGYNCPDCSGHKKYDIIEVDRYFKDHNRVLLSTEYKNNRQPLEYICERGHFSTTTFGNFLRGQGCKQCAIEDNSGEKNYNYNHNLSKEQRKELIELRNSPEHRLWRKTVLERDGSTCCHCGINKESIINGNKIAVHHIFNFSSYVNLRYDPFNGIVLCSNCHDLFHAIFSHRNNNSSQIHEFIFATKQTTKDIDEKEQLITLQQDLEEHKNLIKGNNVIN